LNAREIDPAVLIKLADHGTRGRFAYCLSVARIGKSFSAAGYKKQRDKGKIFAIWLYLQ